MKFKKILYFPLLLIIFQTLSQDYNIKLITGQEQSAFIPFIADLRISQYREYPYLYEGNMKEESAYLSWLLALPSSAIAIAYLGSQPVGFVGGAGFVEFDEHFKGSIELFKNAQVQPAAYYYFTDVIIAHEHRGKKLGTKLFKVLEAHAQSLGYKAGCCVTESHEIHPLKPKDYKSVDSFLQRIGYTKSLLALNFTWMTRQIDGESAVQEHTLTYWLKTLR